MNHTIAGYLLTFVVIWLAFSTWHTWSMARCLPDEIDEIDEAIDRAHDVAQQLDSRGVSAHANTDAMEAELAELTYAYTMAMRDCAMHGIAAVLVVAALGVIA